MDFDLDFQASKQGGGGSSSDTKKDHSPTVADGNEGGDSANSAGDTLLNTNTKASNSSDDFEHIVQEKYDYDFMGGGGDIGKPNATEFANLLDDPFGSKPTTNYGVQNDDFDLLGNTNPMKTATVDFMAAERNSSPAKTAKKSIYDEIENDYLNPYASKNNEKFISSEDLLGDFKTDDIDPIPETQHTTEDPFKLDKIEPIQTIEPEIVHASPPPPPKPIPVAITKPVEIPAPQIQETPASPPPQMKVEPKPIEVDIVKPAVKPVAAANSLSSLTKPRDQMISAEEIFYRIGLVESLIYWRDPKKSGIVFGAGIAVLLAISFFSVISVVAYVSLIALIITMAVRIYKNVLQAVQKTSEGHPFKEYLEYELALPQEKVQQIANVSVVHFNAFLAELRRLFLVEDLVDSIKFSVLLWCLTYLGSWFNGMTLVILGFVALFTLPKVYENNKQSIDTYLDLVRSKVLEITDKVKTAVPIGGKKQESDKDK